MTDCFTDPRPFRRFKAGALRRHEAAKVGAARSKLLGSKIKDPEVLAAVSYLDAWLDRQPADVREYALAKPPRAVASR
jgi:hypothetical protein